MKLLFITKSYSMNKGGKEIYNYNLVKSLKDNKFNIKLIATYGNILNLIWFYPYSLIRGFFSLIFNKIDYIHIGDTFTLPVGMVLAALFNKKISVTLYGLDITYPSEVYQSVFIPLVKKCDKIIVISEATKQEAINKGISKDKLVVMPCGVNIDDFSINKDKNKLKEDIEKKFNLNLKDKKILLTVGRLVKRKGVEWFINEIMPKLEKSYIYLISGEGKEEENITKAIKNNNLEKRVFLLGRADFETLKILYNISDVFVMPNIKVEGDMEGFGIVAIESASVGLPVVASDIEGIKDAVIKNKTGYLVKEKSTKEFIKSIKSANMLNKQTMKTLIKQNFAWDKIAQEYGGVWR
ncbi:glycosyltransferase family 4 protein [Candidatus Pacearchaeota archaeon]|nr:glycosyltransferase family 4 protein [Candidatus Pacearchaeota archaeon]